MTAREMAAKVGSELPNVKAGSLRFWGEWFGRPYDNQHRIMRCWDKEESILFEFDQGEILEIDRPEDLQVSADAFSVRSAARVRWQWYHYGRPQLPENLCCKELAREDSRIEENAVEIL